jgi:hypothetical protein
MSENVIILGAGFSHDAGIPLLRNVVDKMWEYERRGVNGKNALSGKEVVYRPCAGRGELFPASSGRVLGHRYVYTGLHGRRDRKKRQGYGSEIGEQPSDDKEAGE